MGGDGVWKVDAIAATQSRVQHAAGGGPERMPLEEFFENCERISDAA